MALAISSLGLDFEAEVEVPGNKKDGLKKLADGLILIYTKMDAK